MLQVDDHPLLDLKAFVSELPSPIGEMASPDWLTGLLSTSAQAPFRPEESTRSAIRDLLRHGGYKPTGRGKPASEYLVRAASEGALKSINLVVDACNAASLHSGLPITVVDLDLCQPPLRVGIAAEGASYAFNASGQVIDVSGLLCLHDAQGPSGNAVKDSQRTKTHAQTRRTLSLIWGSRATGDLPTRTEAWYRELLTRAGATVRDAR
jgi:DNA/RNA-binding domain of Phe-tRNA-synthetase-like protein